MALTFTEILVHVIVPNRPQVLILERPMPDYLTLRTTRRETYVLTPILDSPTMETYGGPVNSSHESSRISHDDARPYRKEASEAQF